MPQITEVLRRLWSRLAAPARRRHAPGPARQDPADAALAAQPLLNVARLQRYQRLGLLEELIADYVPQIGRLVEVLEEAVRAGDLDAALEALHSLLGTSGETGALALYQAVRGVYVPMLEDRKWPHSTTWLAGIRQLAGDTARALREYGEQHAARRA